MRQSSGRVKFHALLPVRDEADIIEQCLDHLLTWADAVYVFDTWEIVQEVASRDARVTPMRKGGVYYSEARLRVGRSPGGFTTKLHTLVDALGNPVRLLLTPGQRADITQAEDLLLKIEAGAVIADKGYDADALIDRIIAGGAAVVIPPKRNRTVRREYNRNRYADRNKVERFFGRIKHYRQVATHYEKTACTITSRWFSWRP